MNTTPRPPTAYPTEFRQLISEKSANFVGREFVFSAINNFLSRQNRGYFTIIGAPGSGKSAILAKYVSENPQVIYYNAEVALKNRADEFLAIVGSELRRRIGNGNALEENWLLSLLLQKVSDLLSPDERLIIAIDALDRIDANHQPPGTNLFYLPRYLPDKVYFILTRRPFLREKSGLLIEAPFQILDLEKYPEENREDVREYVRRNLTPPTPLPYEGRGEEEEEEEEENSPSPARGGGWGERSQFITQLISESDNNFMYLSEILLGISQSFYAELLDLQQFPPGLEAYYQQHWQKMKGDNLSAVELGVLRCLVTHPQGISAELIAEMIDSDEYDVEEVLENWFEFLCKNSDDGEVIYRFYHYSFSDWLRRVLSLD